MRDLLPPILLTLAAVGLADAGHRAQVTAPVCKSCIVQPAPPLAIHAPKQCTVKRLEVREVEDVYETITETRTRQIPKTVMIEEEYQVQKMVKTGTREIQTVQQPCTCCTVQPLALAQPVAAVAVQPVRALALFDRAPRRRVRKEISIERERRGLFRRHAVEPVVAEPVLAQPVAGYIAP